MPESQIDIEWALWKLEQWRESGPRRQVSISLGESGFTLLIMAPNCSWLWTSMDLQELLVEALRATGEGKEDPRWRKHGEGEGGVKAGTDQNPENLQNFSTSP